MNPLTNVKNIQKLNKAVLDHCVPTNKSWHQQYKDSAWIFIGGLSYDLTEGDVICVFSQYGEVVNINLVRDQKTGKSKGYAFLCYEDQCSTILAVDNFNGMKLASRIIRVDHVEEYKVPKIREDMDISRQRLFLEGCAPTLIEEEQEEGKDLDRIEVKKENLEVDITKDKKNKKKEKKSKKMSKRKHCSSSSSESSNDSAAKEKKSHKRKKREKEQRRQ